MKDSFGRKINYLRVSLTDRCNLRCKYCMPEEGIDKCKHSEVLSLEETYQIIESFVELGVDKIRFTGGEPLVRKGIVSLIEKVSKLKGVKDIAMTTNGILLKEMAKDLKDAGLNRVNVSLDTMDSKKFKNITRGGDLQRVLDGIEQAKKVGLSPIKINTVLIGGFNEDEIERFVKLTIEDLVDVRFIELMPIGQASAWAEDKFISNKKILEKMKALRPVKRVDMSSPAVYYKLANARGRVGIINPISCKFCENCNRVRLTASGKLKLCLHSNREINLKIPSKNKEDLKEIIIKAISEKEESHHLEEREYIDRNMNEIGG